jgi:hypothetical protein
LMSMKQQLVSETPPVVGIVGCSSFSPVSYKFTPRTFR